MRMLLFRSAAASRRFSFIRGAHSPSPFFSPRVSRNFLMVRLLELGIRRNFIYLVQRIYLVE